GGGPTRELLKRLVGAFAGDVSLRTGAYAVLGLSGLDADRLDRSARRLLERLVEQLAAAYESYASEGWRWFEPELSYDNARLAQALLSRGAPPGPAHLTQPPLRPLLTLPP